MRLVAGHAAALTLAGIAVGLLCALAFARLLSGMLFGVGPSDPLTYAGGASVLALVALVASLVPDRRAIMVNPVVTLRDE
jgi:putative ABC transport system permease protein